MKKALFKRVISACMMLFLLLGVFCIPTSSEDFSPADEYYRGAKTSQTVWNSTMDGGKYIKYRLPGMVVTKSNTLILYGEARTGKEGDGRESTGDDLCEMDIYIRRSTDGGASFGQPIYIAKGADYRQRGLGETLNNPVMTVGNDGTLHLIFTSNCGEGGVWYTKSTDDGLTWSEERDLSSQLGKGINYTQIACGPGHGVCLDNGRLVIPVWVNFSSYDVYTIYSDDSGSTWKLGKKVSVNTDETSIAVLSDGSVMCNSRETPNRAVSVSANGISRWSRTEYDNTLIDPACYGGMCSVDLKGLPYSLLFVNCASTTLRNKVTVRCSFDDGKTWLSKTLLLDETRGGYADIAVDKNGKCYVAYETGLGETLELVSFSFYDTFCSGNRAAEASVTEFGDALEGMTEANNSAAVESAAEGIMLKVISDSTPMATVDFSRTTKNINLSKLPVMALTVSAKANGKTELPLGIDFATGRNDFSEAKIQKTIKADGVSYTYLIELSEYYGGNLSSLALELYGAEGTQIGAEYTVSSLEFLPDMETAKVKYPNYVKEDSSADNKSEEEPDTSTAEKSENVGEASALDDEKKKGCRSAYTASGILGLALCFAVCILFVNKRRVGKN